MKLSIHSSDAGLTRLECTGEITQSFLWDNANPLEALLGPGAYATTVLVNLASAECVDSAGVGWFITCHQKFKAAGGKLVLHSIPPLVNHIFQLLRMETVLHLAKNEAEAVALGQGAKP